nr:MAG TPA: hypothetical protein [Caudoviricetes sp.]
MVIADNKTHPRLMLEHIAGEVQRSGKAEGALYVYVANRGSVLIFFVKFQPILLRLFGRKGARRNKFGTIGACNLRPLYIPPFLTTGFEGENDRCFGWSFDPTRKPFFSVLILLDGRNAGHQLAQIAFGQIDKPFAGIFEGLFEFGVIIAPSVDGISFYTNMRRNIGQNTATSICDFPKNVNIWFFIYGHFL